MKYILAIMYSFLVLAAPAAAGDQVVPRQVLEEINLARTEPLRYAGYLRTFRGYFRGRYFVLPGSDIRTQTREGTAAIDEAIRFLSRQKARKPLRWSDGLAAAAAELAEDQAGSGDTGHTGRVSRGMRERIEKHGSWEGTIAENIGYGPTDARNMVMQLIIDDGVRNRGHRTNTFNAAFGTAGVACGPHPKFGSMCVIDFAGGFKE